MSQQDRWVRMNIRGKDGEPVKKKETQKKTETLRDAFWHGFGWGFVAMAFLIFTIYQASK